VLRRCFFFFFLVVVVIGVDYILFFTTVTFADIILFAINCADYAT
jgi:hypothetical protein